MTMRAISREPQPGKGAADYFTGACRHSAPVITPAGGATISWWWSCLVVLFALGFVVPVVAQPDSVFKAWYVPEQGIAGNGVAYASNLPNFMQGRNAIAYRTVGRSPVYRTVLPAKPFDTNSVFAWPTDTWFVLRGDFVGSSATDFLDNNGFVYQGIADGMPPGSSPIPSAPGLRLVSSGPGQHAYALVADLNTDGKDDIIPTYSNTAADTTFFAAYLGSADSTMRRVDVPYKSFGIDDSYRLSVVESGRMDRWVVGTFQAKSGGLRLVVCRRDERRGQSFLETYSCDRDNENGGLKGRLVNRVLMNNMAGGTSKLLQEQGEGVLVRQSNGEAIFVSKRYHNTFDNSTNKFVANHSLVLYDLSEDTIRKRKEIRTSTFTANLDVLEHSVDGDSYRDWYWSSGSSAIVFSGRLEGDSVRTIGAVEERAWIRNSAGVMERANFAPPYLNSVEDVSGDGIPDLLASCAENAIADCFMILEGKSNAVSVETQAEAFEILSPHPVKLAGVLRIPIPGGSGNPISVSLTSLAGQSFCTQQLADSGSEYLFDLSRCNVSAGLYLLHVSSHGGQIHSFKVVVED